MIGLRDVSFVLSLFAGLFLLAAGVAWYRIIRKPDRDPPTRKNVRRGGRASMVIVVAFGLSLLAAAVAILGWIQR